MSALQRADALLFQHQFDVFFRQDQAVAAVVAIVVT